MWIPIRDGTYEALNCDKNSSTEWHWYEDATILNIYSSLSACLEVLVHDLHYSL